MKLLLVDNYDSFTFNLVHYLGELGADVEVHRNDKVTSAAVIAADPTPSCCRPARARPTRPASVSTSSQRRRQKIPILGVCLGHQAIGDAFGGKVIRAPVPVHGKLSEIRHERKGFSRHQCAIQATRYHSLVVERETMPRELTVTADTDEGLVMGSRTRGCRCMACNFIPRVSPPSTVTSY